MNNHLIVAVSSGFLILGGCINAKEDVTHNRAYHTDYVARNVYRTTQPMFIQVLDRQKVLREVKGGDARVPPSLDSYWKQGRDGWPGIIGVLEPATTLRISRVIRTYNGEIGNTFSVVAEILDGPNRGLEVDLSMVSREYRQENPLANVPVVNPEVLEAVDVSKSR